MRRDHYFDKDVTGKKIEDARKIEEMNKKYNAGTGIFKSRSDAKVVNKDRIRRAKAKLRMAARLIGLVSSAKKK